MTQKNDTICGRSKKDIRTAYFKSKLPILLADIQSTKEITEEDLAELKEYLEEIREQDSNVIRSLSAIAPEMLEEREEALPDDVLEDILTPEEQEAVDKDKIECEKSFNLANKLINRVSIKLLKREYPDKEEIINTSLELLGLAGWIDKDVIFKERILKKKQARYVAEGRQRKEAEDLAKVSLEYRDYQLVLSLQKRIEEFHKIARKMYDQQR